MTHQPNTITTRNLRAAAALALACLLLVCAAPAFAHGGFDHVIGTVSKVTNNVVTVKTAKGDVDVTLTDKTEITRADQKAGIADLKPGLRVVIDVPEGSKDRVAHSVKVGVAGAGSHK